MSQSDAVDALLQEWREKADELEGQPQKIKQLQDSFYRVAGMQRVNVLSQS